MSIIDLEKLELFKEHSGHILAKPAEQRTQAEEQWLLWAAKRITALEGQS